MKKAVIILLCFSLAVPIFSTFVSANTASIKEDEEMTAELMQAYGGARGIVSMTFDDGIYDTAVWLNQMFEKYGLRGSCMMIMSKINDQNAEQWRELFASGHLEPESHTLTHMPMPAPSWDKYEQFQHNNTEENYKNEIDRAELLIRQYFNHTALCIAPSNNTLCDGATERVMKLHYAMRQGVRWSIGEGKFQSLDPVPGSNKPGGWYNLYMMGFAGTEDGQLIAGLNHIAEEGGWYVTMCHGIGLEEGSGDSTYARSEPVFQYMSKLQDEGKIWVTTFGDATRYIRERQNTTLTYKEEGGVYKLTLTMATKTADNLPLDPKVFHHPLTVKVRVPDGYDGACYLADGEAHFAAAFEEEGKSYAYINARPNGEEIEISFRKTEGISLAPDRRGTIGKNGEFTANLGSISSTDRSKILVSFARNPEKVYVNANLSLQFGGSVSKEIRVWAINNERASAMSEAELYEALAEDTVAAELIGAEPIFVFDATEKSAEIDVTDYLGATGGRATFLIDTDTLPSLGIPLIGAQILGDVLKNEAYYSEKKLDFHHSLTIEDELIYNIYFTPTEAVESLTVGEKSYAKEELATLPTAEISGKTYRHIALPVALKDAATLLCVRVELLTEAGATAEIKPTLSVLGYLDALLSKEDTDEELRVMILDLMLLIRASVQQHSVDADVSAVGRALKKYDYSPLLASKLIGAVANIPSSVERISLRLDGVPCFVITPKSGTTYTFTKPSGDVIPYTTEVVDGVSVYVLPIRTFHLFLPVSVNARDGAEEKTESFTLANYFATLTGKERELVKYAAAFAESFDVVRDKKE